MFVVEFLFEVVARFVGVSFCAFFTWCGSGFRASYRSEWRRIFKNNPGTYAWIDVVGAVVLLAVIVGSLWAIHALLLAGVDLHG